jgi:acyl-CoA thioester hydrolase
MSKDEIIKEIELYKHRYNSIVRFNEVDSSRVVHNVQYFFWLEHAKTEYFKSIGVKFSSKTFLDEFPIMVVRNEMDYFSPAVFNDEYTILTKTSFIKKSSFGVDNIILSGSKLIAKAKCVYVYLSFHNLQSEPIPEEVRKLLIEYEGKNLEILC